MAVGIPKDGARNILVKALESLGFEVVETSLSFQRNTYMFRAFIDTDQGVTADDCAKAVRRLRDIIFQQDLLPKDYQLEISSPGLDRPLKSEKQFRRHIGRRMKIRYQDADEEKHVAGTLVRMDGMLVLETDKHEEIVIAFDRLIEGKIQLPW